MKMQIKIFDKTQHSAPQIIPKSLWILACAGMTRQDGFSVLPAKAGSQDFGLKEWISSCYLLQ
jgi:hypothetical protein